MLSKKLLDLAKEKGYYLESRLVYNGGYVKQTFFVNCDRDSILVQTYTPSYGKFQRNEEDIITDLNRPYEDRIDMAEFDAIFFD